MKRCAAIDIGSQTIRLLIADCADDALYPLVRDREIVGLGMGMEDDDLLQPERIDQAIACIQRFCEQARARDAHDILAAATACVRRAENRDDFIERIRLAAGICPTLLSGEQEAELSLAGVQAVMNNRSPYAAVIDIGGGSIEINFLESGRCTAGYSLPLGVIDPAERFLRSDPPLHADMAVMREWLHVWIRALMAHTPSFPGIDAIATAGTATTLAAMDLRLREYDPARINAHVLSASTITSLLKTMAALPCAARAELPGLEPGRATVILPGAVILLELLTFLGCDTCTVSDAGLLEGIIIKHAALSKIIEKA